MQTVASLTTYDLQNILEQYPWFTIARKEYVRRCGKDDRDALMAAAADAGIFLLSRKEFILELLEQKTFAESEQPREEHTGTEKKKIYIIGGDYFGKEDFKELEEKGEAFDVDSLRYNPIESTVSSMEAIPSTGSRPLAEEEIYTETLANIYAGQGFCDRAVTIYKKLILLYPEKSAYFADLIESARIKAETIKH